MVINFNKLMCISFLKYCLLFANSSLATTPSSDEKFINIEDRIDNIDDSDYYINSQQFSLLDLIAKDLAFIRKHPTNVMSAAQIIYSIIKDQGVETKYIPGYGLIKIYNLFSKNISVTNDRRIIGQYEGIKAVVDGIESQARGVKSGVTVPLLVGTHGTGKTEFRSVIANALENLTRNSEKFHIHEISWIVEELKNIPEVRNYIKARQDPEFRSPLHSAPISILPKVYQKAIMEEAKDIIEENVGPYPVSEFQPDPISKFIVDAILKYFTHSEDQYVIDTLNSLGIKKAGSNRLSPLDQVKILDHYVVIRRLILGRPGTVPLIDAQGDEINYQGLIMSENPLFRMLEGPSNVWSWNYNGAVLSGSRNFIFLDEFYRNERSLRDIFLKIFESRAVSWGGGPDVPMDTVIVAASNSANLDIAKADSASDAQVDRMRPIPFEWSTHPGEIAKILLYMNGKGMMMQRLDNETLEEADLSDNIEDNLEPINIDLLFPELLPGRSMQTSDGRYKLIYGDSEEEGIFISPHAIMFMADFIACTRMNVNPKDALDLGGSQQLIGTPMFKDHLARLQVLKQEVQIQSAQQKELYKLSRELKEGSFGLSARVAGRWLSESINEAKLEGNDNTLTPVILRKVYEKFQIDGALEAPDLATEQLWSHLMDMVAEGILIRKLRSDIYQSFHKDGRAQEIYDEIILEIVALTGDPEATTFETNSGQYMSIDRDRMKKIASIYEKSGKYFDIPQIGAFYFNQIARYGGKTARDKDLLDAISQHLAENLDAFISVKGLLDFAEKKIGNKDISERYHSVEENLIHKLGYNKRSILDALAITKQYNEKLER